MDADDCAIRALIRAYIACRLAIDSLPYLPDAVRRQVSEPVTALCHVIGPALDEIKPGFLDSQQ